MAALAALAAEDALHVSRGVSDVSRDVSRVSDVYWVAAPSPRPVPIFPTRRALMVSGSEV